MPSASAFRIEPGRSTPALLTSTSNSISCVRRVMLARSRRRWRADAAGARGELGQLAGAARQGVHLQAFGLHRRSTVAAPMPEEAPVTRAVL
jgi:hypothetical protein